MISPTLRPSFVAVRMSTEQFDRQKKTSQSTNWITDAFKWCLFTYWFVSYCVLQTLPVGCWAGAGQREYLTYFYATERNRLADRT